LLYYTNLIDREQNFGSCGWRGSQSSPTVSYVTYNYGRYYVDALGAFILTTVIIVYSSEMADIIMDALQKSPRETVSLSPSVLHHNTKIHFLLDYCDNSIFSQLNIHIHPSSISLPVSKLWRPPFSHTGGLIRTPLL
jgi:hypothetical protein